jgi:hypothetical protein
MGETKKEIKEKLIAKRVPKGDRWALLTEPENVIEGLTALLQRYVTKYDYRGAFILKPLTDGGIICIPEEEEVPVVHKTWSLYGED